MKEVYNKRGHTVVRKIVDEILLVPVHGDLANLQRIFVLNPVAEHIWSRLDGQQTLGEICARLTDSFSVREDEARNDLREFIDELLQAGLVERVV